MDEGRPAELRPERRDIPEVKWAARGTAVLGLAFIVLGWNQAQGSTGAGLAGNILQVVLGIVLLAVALALSVIAAAWTRRFPRARG